MKDDNKSKLLAIGKDIKAGKIKRFSDIYDERKKTAIARVLNVNLGVFVRGRESDPTIFRVGEILKLALLMKVESCVLLKLIEADVDYGALMKEPKQPAPPSKEVVKAAKAAQKLFSSGMPKGEICKKMEISRPTLDKYLEITAN